MGFPSSISFIYILILFLKIWQQLRFVGTSKKLSTFVLVAELFRMFNEPSENLLLQTTAFAAEIGLATSQKKSSAENASGGVSATAETYPRRPLASASRPSFAQQEPAFDMAGHPPSYRYD